MRKLMVWLLGIVVVLAVIFFLGPRPLADPTIRFDASAIGNDFDAYFKNSEAKIENIRPGAEKEIIWADPQAKAKTSIAIVYIHGFSATKFEARPVPDLIAKEFGANLLFTRLTGHGVSGDQLTEATFNDWVNDLVETMIIANQIGDKLILMSASTGSTLVTWGAGNMQELFNQVAGNIMVSPNYALHAASIGLMTMPWAETLLPMIVGAERSWEASNEGHAKWWTNTYPSRAIFPMAALMRETENTDKSKIKLPSLVFYSKQDKVVVPDVIKKAISEWGGKVETVNVTNADDPNQHVITGDILSPSTTADVAAKSITWVKTLK